jgi:predicted nicotinamide N-methyase
MARSPAISEWLRATVDVSFDPPQAYEIVNVAFHREYSPAIVLIFSHGRKYLYHV